MSKRYIPRQLGNPNQLMTEHKAGTWVSHDDYKELEADNTRLREQLDSYAHQLHTLQDACKGEQHC